MKIEVIKKTRNSKQRLLFRQRGTSAGRKHQGTPLLSSRVAPAASVKRSSRCLLFLLRAPTASPAGVPGHAREERERGHSGGQKRDRGSEREANLEQIGRISLDSSNDFFFSLCLLLTLIPYRLSTSPCRCAPDVHVLIIGYIWTENVTRNGASNSTVDEYLVASANNSSAITVYLVIRVRANECLHWMLIKCIHLKDSRQILQIMAFTLHFFFRNGKHYVQYCYRLLFN